VSILAFYAGSEKALSDFLGYSISKYRFWINEELALFADWSVVNYAYNGSGDQLRQEIHPIRE